MNRYIAFKQEHITSPNDLNKYSYFIVQAIEEFKVYNRKTFMEKFKDFQQIINLYCIHQDEELRFNRQNWLRIYETGQQDLESIFKYQVKEEKQFTVAEKCGGRDSPITVYKYYLKPGTNTDTGSSDKILIVPDIPIIYRHSIKAQEKEV
jgi:hypothetical protein